MRFAEKEIKDLGVSVMMMSTKIHKPLDKLFLRLGYAPIERIYSKNLGIG